MKKILSVLFAGAALLLVHSTFAQTKKVVADKIIAKVGDRIILKSDLINAIADLQRGGQELPENAQCVLMQSELIKKALVLQAEKDSLLVGDDEIEGLLENQIRGFIQQYGSKEALEEIAGRSIYQLKEDFRKPFKEREMANKMRAKILENVKITPVEVKAYYEEIPKDSLPYYESEVEIGQIIAYPKPSREIESYVAKQLNDIKKQIENGKKFEQMAKVYSEDPGVKENGGQYNLNKNDKQWDQAFFNAAFKLKDGQISNIVKSKFGLHIIQMVSRSGDDAIVRHILMIPPVTEDEIGESTHKLDSIRNLIVAGKMSFGEAVNKYSDEEESKFTGGFLNGQDGTFLTYDQLDRDMLNQVKGMQPGQYTKPTPFVSQQGKKGVRVLYLRTRTLPHRENLKDDYNRLASRALEDKKQGVLEKWFNEHINNYYIYIDQDYNSCAQLKPWLDASAKN